MRKIPTGGLALLLLLAAGAAHAQGATTRLQDATVVAKGTTIAITRLPIHTTHGVIYRDVTIQLQVDDQGHVTLATGSGDRTVAAGMPGAIAQGPARGAALDTTPSGEVDLPQRPSPPIVMQIFRAGTYTGADGSLMHVSDRGNDLVHHVPMWTLTADGGGALGSATWYSGPPNMNPRSSRLTRAGITDTAFAYGTSDSGASELFGSGALIGVAQSGDTLRIVSFRHGCCTDEPEPVASLIYTYFGH